MADVDMSADGLPGFDFDSRALQYPYTSRVTWPITIPAEQNAPSRTAPQNADANTKLHMKRSTTPLHNLGQVYEQPISQQEALPQLQSSAFMSNWQLPQPSQSQQIGYTFEATYPTYYGIEGQYAMPYQSPTEYGSTQGQYEPGPYLPMANQMDSIAFGWQDLSNDPMTYPLSNGLPDMLAHQNYPNSPTDTALEVRSLSSSDNGWASVEYPHQQQSLDGSYSFDGSYQSPNIGAIFNPEQTLHGRTFSDSSFSDVERQSRRSWGSFVDLNSHAIGSPGSDPAESGGEMEILQDRMELKGSPPIKQEEQHARFSTVVTSSIPKAVRVKTSSSPQRSPTSTGRISPPGRRQTKKCPTGKASKATIRRQSQVPKTENTEKRVGRRKGPLRPEQRKQASEIRKLGACIRCKFLKKTVRASNPSRNALANRALV